MPKLNNIICKLHVYVYRQWLTSRVWVELTKVIAKLDDLVTIRLELGWSHDLANDLYESVHLERVDLLYVSIDV